MNGSTRNDGFHATSLRDLAGLTAYLEQVCRPAGEVHGFAVRLAVEEAFANIFLHGYAGGEGPVSVYAQTDADAITVVMHDHAPPFDPASAPVPNVDAAPDEREVGGLGLYLLREMMDDVQYEPGGADGNVLTLVRKLPGTGKQPSEN